MIRSQRVPCSESCGLLGLSQSLFSCESVNAAMNPDVSKWIISPDEVKYDKNKVLGKGSFGTVYEGICRGKKVAVKRLARQVKPSNLKDLVDEVDKMSRLLHPNVLLFMAVSTELGNLMIITELMPNGSVEDLIKKRADITTYQRMLMAKDAALGVNWLHCSNPPIIHSDLKLRSNLLVDENLKVKVCDFGLSIRKIGEYCKEEARGSPLMMSPECLTGQPFNEKSDTYSFGLLLWELYTRKEIFPDVTEEAQLIEIICRNKERPPIPSDCPESLAQLLKCCWDADPERRPAFEEILESLDQILIDVAIDDKVGRKFWKKHFLGRETVSWSDFASTFATSLGLHNTTDSGFQCLRALLNLEPEETDGSCSVVQFGNVLKSFGPLKFEHDGITILDSIRNVLLMKGFHLKATKNDSEKLLASKPPGTYLLRFSSEPGAFGMSCVSEKGAVAHFRLKYTPSLGFEYDKQVFSTLDDFVERVSPVLGLKSVLESLESPLAHISSSYVKSLSSNDNNT